MKTAHRRNILGTIARIVVAVLASALCIAFAGKLLSTLFLGKGCSNASVSSVSPRAIIDSYDMYVTNSISNALDGVLTIEKVYRLSDVDLVAPEPDQTRFGQTTDPDELKKLLDDAKKILDGQTTLFSPDIQFLKKSTVNYYLDQTIFAVTWKQVIDNGAYTISEIKIAHPSQFRRFLADGQYGSDKQYLTTEMASSVNAVVASAGDFYKYRREGIVIYNGEVKRINDDNVDTCCIDENGDLVFMFRGTFPTIEEAQKYVDENSIRFSLAFGPILVNNGERCEPKNYQLGEVNSKFPRAALCQMGPLHYLLITVNGEGSAYNFPDIHTFAARVAEFGCEKAYSLDGGQTATIAMNGELMNQVNYGSQRQISDIIYFATALQHPKETQSDDQA